MTRKYQKKSIEKPRLRSGSSRTEGERREILSLNAQLCVDINESVGNLSEMFSDYCESEPYLTRLFKVRVFGSTVSGLRCKEETILETNLPWKACLIGLQAKFMGFSIFMKIYIPPTQFIVTLHSGLKISY